MTEPERDQKVALVLVIAVAAIVYGGAAVSIIYGLVTYG